MHWEALSNRLEPALVETFLGVPLLARLLALGLQANTRAEANVIELFVRDLQMCILS